MTKLGTKREKVKLTLQRGYYNGKVKLSAEWKGNVRDGGEIEEITRMKSDTETAP